MDPRCRFDSVFALFCANLSSKWFRMSKNWSNSEGWLAQTACRQRQCPCMCGSPKELAMKNASSLTQPAKEHHQPQPFGHPNAPRLDVNFGSGNSTRPTNPRSAPASVRSGTLWRCWKPTPTSSMAPSSGRTQPSSLAIRLSPSRTSSPTSPPALPASVAPRPPSTSALVWAANHLIPATAVEIDRVAAFRTHRRRPADAVAPPELGIP